METCYPGWDGIKQTYPYLDLWMKEGAQSKGEGNIKIEFPIAK